MSDNQKGGCDDSTGQGQQQGGGQQDPGRSGQQGGQQQGEKSYRGSEDEIRQLQNEKRERQIIDQNKR